MAKKATQKDYDLFSKWQEAQNLSRYNSRSVPQKPVSVSGKKTVPEVLDWGAGIPKDYLAYLNKQEMVLVQKARKYKGKRSYKGIPAYPDPGDTAAGDRGQGTSSSAGLGNNTSSSPPGAGRDSSRGLGQGAGGSAIGRGGGVGGREGGGGGSSVSGIGGAGGVGGGVGGTRSSTDSASQSAVSAGNPQDKSAMQSAAERDAVKVARESSAFRGDAYAGGIRSIGVGPDGAKINISNPSESAISGALSRVASATYRDVTPTSPGGGGMGQQNARRGSSTVAVGPSSGVDARGNIATGSPYGVSPAEAQRMDSVQASMDRYRLTRDYNERAEREKIAEQQDLANRIAEMNRLAAAPDWQFNEERFGWLKAPPGPGIAEGGIGEIKTPSEEASEAARVASTYGGYGNFTTPADTYSRLGRTVSSAYGVSRVPYSPETQQTLGESVGDTLDRAKAALGLGAGIPEPTEQLRVLSPAEQALRRSYGAYEENAELPAYTPKQFDDRIPPTEEAAFNRPRYAAGTYTQPYDASDEDVIDLTQEAYEKSRYPRLSPEGGGIRSISESDFGETVPVDESGGIYGPETPAEDGVIYDGEGNVVDIENLPEEGELPPGVNPAQDVPVYPEPSWVQENILSRNRYTRYLDKAARYLGQKEFDSLTDQEKRDLAAKWVENNRRTMQGDIQPNRQDLRDVQIPVQPPRQPAAPSQGDGNQNQEDSYGRPYKYYRWDLGMGIPSPGDPDYNEYMRYLELREVDYD
jgi:hypothetical protein